MLNMAQKKANLSEKMISKKEAVKLLNEKAQRAEKAAKVWDNHPLFKGELSKITEAKTRQNAAINLTNQARYMRQLNEQETSAEFQRMAPANMMRLVQLTMTNLNRGNVFSEYAMETARDAIYYVKPFFSKSIGDPNNLFAERSRGYGASDDPYGFKNGRFGEDTEVGGYNGHNPAYGGQYKARNSSTNTNARKSAYETKETRFAGELANGSAEGTKVTFNTAPFGKTGNKYVPGFTKIYNGTNEQDTIAVQDPNTFEFLVVGKYYGVEIKQEVTDGVVSVEVVGTPKDENVTIESINAVARFDSETDYEGRHLGEVQLDMSVYELRPHRTSIGVSWTKLSEITLDASFNTQIDDILLTAAADTIHQQMDYAAFMEAYDFARANPEAYHVEFDAGYATVLNAEGKDINAGTKDSYQQNAQTFSSAISLASAALYSDINRGSVDKMICGISTVPYLKMNNGFEAKGVQDATGVFKFGELDGIELYQAPIEVIPHDEILCVHKNNKVENDVAIVYGTLIPFVSNKLEYPTFYTRAGLANFGDRAVLNQKYLSIIKIINLKDTYKGTAENPVGTVYNTYKA